MNGVSPIQALPIGTAWPPVRTGDTKSTTALNEDWSPCPFISARQSRLDKDNLVKILKQVDGHYLSYRGKEDNIEWSYITSSDEIPLPLVKQQQHYNHQDQTSLPLFPHLSSRRKPSQFILDRIHCASSMLSSSSTSTPHSSQSVLSSRRSAPTSSSFTSNSCSSMSSNDDGSSNDQESFSSSDEEDDPDEGEALDSDMDSTSDEKYCWTTSFFSVPGHLIYLEIPEAFILDEFNLTDLPGKVPFYKEALSMVLHSTYDVDLPDAPPEKVIRSSAKLLYTLIHARYILSKSGLHAMLKRYEAGFFGSCSRYYCFKSRLLPIGLCDLPSQARVQVYCPSCNDVYQLPPMYHRVDGAAFGTSFPHIFFMTFPHLLKESSYSLPEIQIYEPRIYGFKLYRRGRMERKFTEYYAIPSSGRSSLHGSIKEGTPFQRDQQQQDTTDVVMQGSGAVITTASTTTSIPPGSIFFSHNQMLSSSQPTTTDRRSTLEGSSSVAATTSPRRRSGSSFAAITTTSGQQQQQSYHVMSVKRYFPTADNMSWLRLKPNHLRLSSARPNPSPHGGGGD